MTEEKTKRKIPIKEGIFKLTANGNDGYLVASKCKSCGEIFHPLRLVCLNCFSRELEEIPLGEKGKIVTYTVARIGIPQAPLTPPFILGIVELSPKIQVLTLLKGFDDQPIEIGREVILYFWGAGKDDEGNDLMAYAFRP